MNDPWAAARLRSLRPHSGPEVLFGYMHEDPAPESSLLPPNGVAACVLSAGDMAFALVDAGARHVTAADPNPAQHALVRLKLAAATCGWTLDKAVNTTVGAVLPTVADHRGMRASDFEFWRSASRQKRPLIAAGTVDARLRLMARWVLPLLMKRGFGSWRWAVAWSALGLVLRTTFPATLRQALPTDITQRLKTRFERQAAASEAGRNPWLQRVIQAHPESSPWIFASTWPASGMNAKLVLHEGLLGPGTGALRCDLIATSNIFDTSSADALYGFLRELHPQPGCRVVVRSLFRELEEWPALPPGWELEKEITGRLQAMDQSPLCRVSLVARYRADT